MNIQEILQKCKALYEDTDVFLVAVIILVAATSFGFGRLSMDGQHNVRSASASSTALQVSTSTGAIVGGYVASKTGTTYFFPWCAGAEKIPDENKIWFTSSAEAEAKGYTPAGNCKGM